MSFHERRFTHVTPQLLRELNISCVTPLTEDSGSSWIPLDFVPSTFSLCCFTLYAFVVINHGHGYSDMLNPVSPQNIKPLGDRVFKTLRHEEIPEGVHWQPYK